MNQRKTGTKIMIAGIAMLLAAPFASSSAYAEQARKASNKGIVTAKAAHVQAPGVTKSHGVAYSSHVGGKARFHGRVARNGGGGGGLSCVPFARMESGIVVAGNAWQWWGNAAGVYARGTAPEPGSVLAFRANGHMRMGHVAVVARVINGREVLIDHANWPGGGRGGVSQSIPVVDVSEANDWSAVRVGLGRSGDFGSTYPTYGFIYDRPDTGTLEARRQQPAPQVASLNPAPRDLRSPAQRRVEEVAEAPRQSKRQTILLQTRGN